MHRAYTEIGDPGLLEEASRLERQVEQINSAIERAREREAARPAFQRRATILFPGSTGCQVFDIRWYREACLSNLANVSVRLPNPPQGGTPAFNLMLATSFFAATNSRSGTSRIMPMTLGAIRFDDEEFVLRYHGPRLTSAHADIFLGILHYVQQAHFGTLIEIPAREFLKLIGRHPTSGENRDALLQGLRELSLGKFELETKSPGGERKVISEGWNLLSKYQYSELPAIGALRPTVIVRVAVPIETAQLFGLASWSSVDLHVRASLRGAITKWLYGYLCSKGFQGRVAVKELLALSGCRQPLPAFRGALEKAVEQLRGKKVLTAKTLIYKDELHWAKLLTRRAQTEVENAVDTTGQRFSPL